MFRNSIKYGMKYILKIRESDQLKTALDVYAMESHKKILMPDYQKN